jgi:aryl-alcohol dehydrogenase (NADP+)
MFAWQFARMLHTAEARGWTRFVSMQNHYNLVYREEEREMLPLCREEGIGVIPWSPVARGFLAGNRGTSAAARALQTGTSSEPDAGARPATIRARTDDIAASMYVRASDVTIADRVAELARRRGVAPAQIALAWVISRPIVTAPIVGASKLEHLDELIAALDVRLDADETAFLEAPYEPHPVLGHS